MDSLSLLAELDLRDLPRINVHSLDKADREHYQKYELALIACYKGASIRQAAKAHNVRKGTLSNVVAESVRTHPDGRAVGFRACLRHRRRVRNPTYDAPTQSTEEPKTLGDVERRVPTLTRMFETFRGRLPERNRRSKTFEAFLKRVMRVVAEAGYGHLPMWQSASRGRRAILRRLQSIRALIPAPDADEPAPGTEHATRLDQLFQIQPLDRLEGDEHRTDVRWHVLVPARRGGWVTKAISYLLLTVLIDVGSHAIVGWRIVVGRRFNRYDLLRLAVRCLKPWRKRTLVVNGLRYHPDAWMPSSGLGGSAIARVASLAMDNAMAHLAEDATKNLADFFRGVTNLGYPRNPEGRPYIEALFRHFEELLFRLLAGSFRPAGEYNQKEEPANNRKPEDYPVQLQALEDLVDVIVTKYNVTAQDALDGRSPKEVFQSHFGDAVAARSTLTDDDAEKLVAIRATVTIRGKRGQRQPFVKWHKAVYRSKALNGKYKLLGKSFQATLNADDIRRMYLWQDGELVAILHSLPPWADKRHDIETRDRAETCRSRGLLIVEPYGDAVEAYEAHVREWASTYTWAAEEFLRMDLYDKSAKPSPDAIAPKRSAIFDVPPRKRT